MRLLLPGLGEGGGLETGLDMERSTTLMLKRVNVATRVAAQVERWAKRNEEDERNGLLDEPTKVSGNRECGCKW